MRCYGFKLSYPVFLARACDMRTRYSALSGRRRPWQTAGHVSPRILEILIYSIWRKELSLIALSKQEIRATGRYGQLILLKFLF